MTFEDLKINAIGAAHVIACLALFAAVVWAGVHALAGAGKLLVWCWEFWTENKWAAALWFGAALLAIYALFHIVDTLDSAVRRRRNRRDACRRSREEEIKRAKNKVIRQHERALHYKRQADLHANGGLF